MSSALVVLLQQGPPDRGFSFENLIQIAIVVIFFVLPGLRSLFEVRKRRGQPPGSQPAKRARKAREAATQGRDLWREILGGGTGEAPPRPPASGLPPRPKPEPVVRPSPAAPRPLEPRPMRIESAPLPALAPEAPPGKVAGQTLGRLESGLGPAGGARLESTLRPREVEDPATLDDEMGERWGTSPEAALVTPGAPTTRLGPVDWRQAVLLSELLSPPLALRGSAFAWPGPPAALSR